MMKLTTTVVPAMSNKRVPTIRPIPLRLSRRPGSTNLRQGRCAFFELPSGVEPRTDNAEARDGALEEEAAEEEVGTARMGYFFQADRRHHGPHVTP